jgi:hypothetical protein
MFVAFGFAQVLHIAETKGRFYRFNMQTPEGFIFDASLWMVLDLLETLVEGELFSFSGFCQAKGQMSMMGFRPAFGMDPSKLPPTSTCTTGTITTVQEDDFELEYQAYDKETKTTLPLAHTVLLRGDRWEKRKTVLRTGTQVQVAGTLDGVSATDCDEFWVFFGKSQAPSPRKKTFHNVFDAHPAVPKPLVFLSDTGDMSEVGACPSSPGVGGHSTGHPFPFPSSPLRVGKTDDEDDVPTKFGKGKSPGGKRQRR